MVLSFETPINYELINDAIRFYKKRNYKYIEVPWIISTQAMNITSPKNKRRFKTFLGELVASAEQSFLELILQNKLEKGKYITCTPCFRDEKKSPNHYSWFMKVELINIIETKKSIKNKSQYKDKIEELIEDATDFYSRFIPIKKIKTKEGIDLTYNNLELGSYGIRQHKNILWIYGTGLAEPRFSEAHQTMKKGYHNQPIPKEKYGSVEKIFEEYQEFKDSLDSENKLMSLVELSDLIGAIEGYLITNYKQTITLDDLLRMKNQTQQAFQTGKRK